MTFWLAIVSIAGTLLIACWWDNKGQRALYREQDTREALFDWRWQNPGVYLGLSDHGKKLLQEAIEAYDEFLKYWPFIPDDGRREFLLSLYNDLPPNHPKRSPRPRPRRAFLFLLSFLKIYSRIEPTMPTNVEVKKNSNENALSLVRRFQKRVQESGVLPRVRSLRYSDRSLSELKVKRAKLKKLAGKEKYELAKRMGKLIEKKKRR